MFRCFIKRDFICCAALYAALQLNLTSENLTNGPIAAGTLFGQESFRVVNLMNLQLIYQGEWLVGGDFSGKY